MEIKKNAKNELVSPEVRAFFDTTMKCCAKGLEYWGVRCVGMSELDDAILFEHPHPTRENEFVAIHDRFKRELIFSASFIKECFEASKNNRNTLRIYLMLQFPIE